jgi:pimeloyl-ACP methyl ester carboxylesterase
MWGYSSGALATCSAVEMQPTYAPELLNNIIASSLGGIPVNINATFAQSSNTFFSELSIVGMNSFMLADKKFAAHIDSALRPEMKDQFYKARSLCFAELAYEYAFRDLDSFFTRPDYANHHVVEKMLKSNVLGQGDTPTIPLFIYHATDDDITPFSYVQQLYSKWCSNGANIEMVQDDTFRHMGVYLAGMGDLLLNLERQFKNPHSYSGCSIRRTTTAILDRGAFSTVVKALIDAFYGIFGFPLGPKTTVPTKR